jgi:hypothetical protein
MAFVGHEFIGVQERMFVMLSVLVVSCDNKTPPPFALLGKKGIKK